MSEKFVSPCPPPTPYERELAEILIEECAEVQQRATKLLRFGIAEVQPGQALTNAQRLGEEVGDLLETLDWALRAGIIDQESIHVGQLRKRAKLDKYLQHKPAEPAPAS